MLCTVFEIMFYVFMFRKRETGERKIIIGMLILAMLGNTDV